jgi:hypothetical protein
MNNDLNYVSQGEAAALTQNPYVARLLDILQENGRDTSGLTALLGYIGDMEGFVKRAEDTISEMKSRLDEMKEFQNHPVKAALQNTIKTLDRKVAEIKGRLGELKTGIADGCKNAVSAFKEKGISALNDLASFFHIKSGLQDRKKDIDAAIRADDRAVAKIEAFANEYHAGGRALKNMARMIAGKEPIDARKEAGKLAKTVAAPYKAQKAALTGLRKAIDKSITAFERLENARQTVKVRDAAAKKPSLLGALQKNAALVDRAKREVPVRQRARHKATEL